MEKANTVLISVLVYDFRNFQSPVKTLWEEGGCRYNVPCWIWAPWLSILPVSIHKPKRHHWRLGNPLGSGTICHHNYLYPRGWSHKLPSPSQPEPPDIWTSQHVCIWLCPLHNCSTWSSVTKRLSRVVPKVPDVWFPSLSQVPKVVQSQTVMSFSRWPLATTLWNVVTNKHKKCFAVTQSPSCIEGFPEVCACPSTRTTRPSSPETPGLPRG